MTNNITNYLETMDEMRRGSYPTRFASLDTVEGLLLKRGRAFELSPASFKGKRGKPKGCYMNAGRRALNEGLPYVEGFVAFRGLPIAHAWNVDEDGRVIEPTLSGRDRAKLEGYWGIHFSEAYLRETILDREVWGIFPEMGDARLAALLAGERPDAFALELVQSTPI